MSNRKAIPGSHRRLLKGSKSNKKPDPNLRIEVTVRVRSRAVVDWEPRLISMGSKPLSERTYLSREELAARRGADSIDLARVEAFAHAHHLTVLEASIPKRIVRLSGTVADLQRAFGVKLREYESQATAYRGRTGPVYVPSELAEVVEGVFGLDNRPTCRRRERAIRSVSNKPASRSASGKFTVAELMRLYDFPTGLNGEGQCIAIIELNSIDVQGTVTGTGYAVSDLEAHFKKLGRAVPSISAIGVAGGINKPDTCNGTIEPGDMETALDISIVGAAVPAAKIAVYFAPNTEAGFLEAVTAAVQDTLRNPSVISISWGMAEESATDQFLKSLNEVLKDAAALGVTVCCETGDNGSADQPPQLRDGHPHVEFPASSPFALACGGTKLVPSGTTRSTETVWNEKGKFSGASGGGVSNKFPRPKYQVGVKIPRSPQGVLGRGIPDVAGNALGYSVTVCGKEFPGFGTSAVAPLWASLIALINQALQANGQNQVGFLTPLIYRSPAVKEAFRDIVEGNNDIDGKLKKYAAGRGWDPCSGMGSPNALKLLNALKGHSKRISKGAKPRGK